MAEWKSFALGAGSTAALGGAAYLGNQAGKKKGFQRGMETASLLQQASLPEEKVASSAFWDGFEKEAVTHGWVTDKLLRGSYLRAKANNRPQHESMKESPWAGMSDEALDQLGRKGVFDRMGLQNEATPEMAEAARKMKISAKDRQDLREILAEMKKELPKKPTKEQILSKNWSGRPDTSQKLSRLPVHAMIPLAGGLLGYAGGGERDEEGKVKNRHIGAIRSTTAAGAGALAHKFTPEKYRPAATAGSAVLGYLGGKYLGPKYDRERQE